MAQTDARTEEILGQDVRLLYRNYFSLLGSNAITAVISFGNALLLLQVLGNDGYGKWSFYMSIVTGTVILGTDWTLSSLVRFGCEEMVSEGTIRRAFWARSTLLALSLVAVGGALWLGETWLRDYFGHSGSATLLVIAGAIAVSLSLHAQSALQAAKQFHWSGAIRVLERGGLLAALAVATTAGVLSLQSAIVCFVLTSLIAGLSLVVMLERGLWLPFRWDRGMVHSLFSFSLPFLLFNPFRFLDSGYLDVLILKPLVSYQALGMYYFAVQMIGLLNYLSTTASSALTPTITTLSVLGRKELVVQYLTRLLPYLLFLWALLLSIVMAITPYALPIILGKSFDQNVIKPFSILLLSSGLAGIWLFAYGPVCQAYKWTWLSPAIVVLPGIANVGLDLLLIPRFGTEGCAFATVVAYLTCAGLYVACTHRLLGISFRSGPLFALAPLAVTLIFFIYWERPLLGLVALGAVCIGIVKACGLFSPEDGDLMRQARLPGLLQWLFLRAVALQGRRA